MRIWSLAAWLANAIGVGANRIKLRALDDPDLEPLWRQEDER